MIRGWDEKKEHEPEVAAAGQEGRNKCVQNSPSISFQLPAGRCCGAAGVGGERGESCETQELCDF